MLIQCVKTKKTHYANVGKLKMYNKRDGDMCMSEKPSAAQRSKPTRSTGGETRSEESAVWRNHE
jgi:hypothetical protein